MNEPEYQLYTDGSRSGKKSGWAFVMVCDDHILVKNYGLCDGDSNNAEHVAIINALRYLSRPWTRVHLVTDRDDVVATLNMTQRELSHQKSLIEQKDGRLPRSKSKRLAREQRYLIHKLMLLHDSSYEVIKSGKHPMHKLADTLARKAVGLDPKKKSKKKKKQVADAPEPAIL